MSVSDSLEPAKPAVPPRVKMIDCHNHMIPDIDDGATSHEMAIDMARESVKCGVSDVFVTPHHGNGAFDNVRNSIIEARQRLQKTLVELKIPLRLHLGSELHLTPELAAQLAERQVLTFADKNKAALIELPKQRLPYGVEHVLGSILDLGITPIIAHPERNAELVSKPEMLLEWAQWGCKTQLTALSVEGRFGDEIQAVSDYWLCEACVHIIASDAHRPTGRSPNLLPSYQRVARHFGKSVAEKLFYRNPMSLINGEPLTVPVVDASIREATLRQRSVKSKRPLAKLKRPLTKPNPRGRLSFKSIWEKLKP